MNDIPKPAEEQNRLHRAIELLEQSEAPFYEACRILRELASKEAGLLVHLKPTGPLPNDIAKCDRCKGARGWWDSGWVICPDCCPMNPADELAKAAGLASEETAQDIAPGHNPDRLSREQVGEGWRLLHSDEIGHFQPTRKIECWDYTSLPRDHQWIDIDWSGLPWKGSAAHRTYRTRLTRAQLRAARGLPPEPAPANPCRDEAGDRALVRLTEQEIQSVWGVKSETFGFVHQLDTEMVNAVVNYAIARERQRTQAPDEAAREVVKIIGEPETCKRCNGAGILMDTTYDRTGAETGCGHCEGAGVIFNFNAKSLANAVAAVRATAGPKPEGRQS